MSLFRNMIENALDAGLTQNEHQVFLALLLQTLGYGKSEDNLTNKRLVNLTDIRMDRFIVARDGLIEKAVFDQAVSDQYDYRYSLPDKFLNGEKFYTPHLQKKSPEFRKTDKVSDPQKAFPKIGDIHNNTLTSSLPKQQPTPILVDKKSANDKKVNKKAVVVVEEKIEVDIEALEVVDSIILPTQISPENQAACDKLLSEITPKQRKRVLETFEHKAQHEVIYRPAGLLMALINAEKDGRLIVPEIKSTPQPILNVAHRSFEKPSEKEEQRQRDHDARLWLQERAEFEGVSVQDFAKQMDMQHLLIE